MNQIVQKFPRILGAAVLLSCAVSAQAGYITTTLASAGPSYFAILALSGVTDFALNGPGTTNGNVGDNGMNTLQLNSSNTAPMPNIAINGNLYLGPNASVNNPAQVTGTVTHVSLSQANTDAINASNTFAGLATNTSVSGMITGTTVINATAMVTVIDITGLNLGNGQTLTLNGAAGDQFVINDSGNFVLNSGRILLTGGLTDSDVVFNVTSSGNAISSSGGLNNESIVNGILLAPNSGVAFAPGQVNGELIAGGSTVHLVSGANVNQPTTMSPEPASWTFLATGILLVGAAVTWKRRASLK